MNSPLLNGALAAARAAGDIILEHSRRPRNVRWKGRADLVTETDTVVEAYLRERLSALTPGPGFMGEESASGCAPHGDCWIVDPVDGTTNFVHGLPFVAVSVALFCDGAIRLGIVHLPFLNECFHAEQGRGAHCNGTPVRVSETTRCNDALVATGFPYDAEKQLALILRRLGSVLPKCRGVRRCGAAAADLAYVASGRFDAFYESGLKPWDFAAGRLLVEEAGGRVSRMDGTPLAFEDSLLATNGRIHEEMIALLK